MKVHLENLTANRRYAVQARGVGDIETDWSPTYFIQTERDRVAPPIVHNPKVDNSTPSLPVTTWYGKDLTLSWDGYSESNESTWDHFRYVVEFISDTGLKERFYTTDKKFTLYYALNAQRFGGYGCHNFSKARVWGEDKTGNPSYGSNPWADGPFVADDVVYVSPPLNNPAPDKLQNVDVNFESPDLLFSWTMPSGPNSADIEYIEIILSNGITTKSFQISPTTSKWTFKYAENKYWFGSLGAPSLSYEISVVDFFRQRSEVVVGTAVNLPPTLPVSGLKAIGVFGGIQVKFDDPKTISGFHKDAWVTEIHERPKSSVNQDEGNDTLTGYSLIIGTTDNSYDYIPPDYVGPPVVTSFAYRWVRAAYVDVFGQRGPVTKASNSAPSAYPTRAIKPGSFTGYAPAPPTSLSISDKQDGSLGFLGTVLATWTPPVDEGLLEYFLEYTQISLINASSPSWTSLRIPADRAYVKSVDKRVVSFTDRHSFAVGDRISVTNIGSIGGVVSCDVVSTTLNTITVSVDLSSTIFDNSYDRGTPGTSVIKSGTLIDVLPGTEYKFRIKSGSTGNTSESSSEVLFKSSGNALVAKKPLEVGTYYDPIDIVEYKSVGGLVTATTLQNPLSNGFSAIKIASGMYVSVRDAAASINGRWPVVSATSSSVSFQLSSSLNIGTTVSDGNMTAGTMALGASVDGFRNGLMIDNSNMWTSDGAFRVGVGYGTSSWTGVRWEPSEQTFYTSGDIDARSGYFSGNVFLRNNGSLATGKVLKIDSTRQVTTNNPYGTGTQITIPIKTSLSIDTFSYAQIISNSTMIDTSGTPAAFVSISNVTNMQTITVSYAAPQSLHNSYINGTILLDSSIVLGDGGLTSTDETGKIKFMLSNSGLNRIGGWDISNNAIKSNIADSTLRSGMSADPLLPSFWAGGNDNSAVWRVNEDGNMYLGDLRFDGNSPSRIFSGVGSFNNSNTPFYLSSDGKFSVGEFFHVNTTSSSYTVPSFGTIKMAAADSSDPLAGGVWNNIRITINRPGALSDTHGLVISNWSDGDGATILFPYSSNLRGVIYGGEDSLSLGGAVGGFITRSISFWPNQIRFETSGALAIMGLPSGVASTLSVSGTGYVYANTSSMRYKQDIYNADTDELMKVLYLEPKIFRYKNKPYNENDQYFNVGYIAEDADALGLEWLVNYDSNLQPYSFNYSLLGIGVLELVKVQQQKINDLNASMVQLNERIAQLEGAQ